MTMQRSHLYYASMMLGIFILALFLLGLVQIPSARAASTVAGTGHHTPHYLRSNPTAVSQTQKDGANLLTYNGGPVMQSTSVSYAIFWQPATLQSGVASHVSSTYHSLIERYFSDIGSSGLYGNNNQYYDGTGHIVNSSSLGGAWVDTSAYPTSGCNDAATPNNCLLDTQLQAEVTKAMAANHWTGGLQHMFFVFTSSGEGSCFDTSSSSCAFTDYCAYHSYFNDRGNQPVIYANMPYTGTSLRSCGVASSPNNDFDADSTINVTSHEHMEAVTDPQLNAWYDSFGNEIGDKCAWNFGSPGLDSGAADVQWNGHYYLVQQEWSNALSGCTLGSQGMPPPSSGKLFVGSNDGYVYALNTSNGSLLWRYKTGGSVSSSPTVVNSVVYIGSKDQYVYALNAKTGSLLWRAHTNGSILSSPTVVNGTLFIGSNDGSLYALNSSNGSLLWHFKAHNAVSSAPTVANSVVYASSSDGYLYALNASRGTQVWVLQISNTVLSAPTVVGSSVYVGASNGYLYALSSSKGALLWRYATGSSVTSRLTVVNGVVYGGAGNGSFYALKATTGTRLWSYQTKGSIASQAAYANGVIYVGSTDANLYALDATKGTLLWHYQAGNKVLSSAAIFSGVVYFGADDANIYALNASTGQFSWHYQTGGAVESSPCISQN